MDNSGGVNRLKRYTQQQWARLVFRRSVFAKLFGATIGVIAIVVATTLAFVSWGIFESYDLLFEPVLERIVLALLLVLMIGFLVVATIKALSRTVYILNSGTYNVLGEFVDQKPGSLVIRRRGLTERLQVIPIKGFVKAELRKSILGNIFGYGHVVLISENTEVPSVRVGFLKQPEKFLVAADQVIESSLGASRLG